MAPANGLVRVETSRRNLLFLNVILTSVNRGDLSRHQVIFTICVASYNSRPLMHTNSRKNLVFNSGSGTVPLIISMTSALLAAIPVNSQTRQLSFPLVLADMDKML